MEYPEGATPLFDDELAGLIPDHIETRGELDTWEALNIEKARRWLKRAKLPDILNEPFVRQLHKRMFDDTWDWAGVYRRTEKNIGVKVIQISEEVPKSCADVKYWIEHRVFRPDEIAVRFHHKLVCIHPFSNGNGRHARLMADLLAERVLKRPPFTWGKASLEKDGEIRRTYIDALHDADHHKFGPLLSFARS